MITLSARNIEIYRRRTAGEPAGDIAADLDVTKALVHDIARQLSRIAAGEYCQPEVQQHLLAILSGEEPPEVRTCEHVGVNRAAEQIIEHPEYLRPEVRAQLLKALLAAEKPYTPPADYPTRGVEIDWGPDIGAEIVD